MPKTAPPPDFQIHIDNSCLTQSTDLNMAPDRIASNETIIHHDSWAEQDPAEEKHQEEHKGEEAAEQNHDSEEEHASESDSYLDPTKSELARERQIDRIEAQIQAAARAVVASIEQDNYFGEESVLGSQIDANYDSNSQLTYGEVTELTYDGTEGTSTTEDERHEEDGEGDSSSHHDGDIDDDVFSQSDHSARSSLNSCHELHSSEETEGTKAHLPSCWRGGRRTSVENAECCFVEPKSRSTGNAEQSTFSSTISNTELRTSNADVISDSFDIFLPTIHETKPANSLSERYTQLPFLLSLEENTDKIQSKKRIPARTLTRNRPHSELELFPPHVFARSATHSP